MTVRNRSRITTAATPQEIANLIEPHTVRGVLEQEEYREYTEDLGALVEDITGVSDRSLTLEVSEELGTSISDWYRYRLSRM